MTAQTWPIRNDDRLIPPIIMDMNIQGAENAGSGVARPSPVENDSPPTSQDGRYLSNTLVDSS